MGYWQTSTMEAPKIYFGPFAQASRIKEVALDVGAAKIDAVRCRLKEAAAEHGSARLDAAAVRALVSSRLLCVKERIHEITAAAASPQGGRATVREKTLENVRALGLGLLEYTEAVLDLILPPTDGDCDGTAEGDEGSSVAIKDLDIDMDRTTWALRIHRVLPIQVLRSFTVQLTKSTALRVTILGMQDICGAVLHRLRVGEIWDLLGAARHAQEKRKAKGEEPGQLANARQRLSLKKPPPVAIRAVQIARQGCERLLGERLIRLLDSSLAMLLPDAFGSIVHGWTQADVDTTEVQLAPNSDERLSDIGQVRELSVGQALTVDMGLSLHEHARRRGFQLVVKNSFIEFVDEEPDLSERRRARSCDVRLAGSPSGPRQGSPTWATNASQGAESSAAAAKDRQDDEEEPCDTARLVVSLEQTSRCTQQEAAEAIIEAHARTASSSSTSQNITPGAAALVSVVRPSTVMLRNVPFDFKRGALLHMLNELGFYGKYNFVYLPVDFTRSSGLGYALVSFADPADADEMLLAFQGVQFLGVPSDAPRCQSSWSEPHRSLADHIERYRNSPVMHHSMPNDYKPLLFVNGERVEFPAPTKPLRAPRIRHLKADH